MELTTKDTIYGTAIILLVLAIGITNISDWYYCSAENSLKQCDELTKYGVPDAKCIIYDAPNDICTSDGIKEAWKPLSDYVGVGSKINVTTVFNCTTIYWNVTREHWKNCTFWENGTQHEHRCDPYNVTTQGNKTTCVQTGYIVNYPKREYIIEGDCCKYYEESPYEEFKKDSLISCKQKQNNICNPKIQQTSKDVTIYDEVGRIYVIGNSEVSDYLRGEYRYFLDKDVYVSKIKEKNE